SRLRDAAAGQATRSVGRHGPSRSPGPQARPSRRSLFTTNDIVARSGCHAPGPRATIEWAPMLDFASPEYRRDPYAVLRRLRETDPLHRHPHGFWMATRHADVRFFERDPRFGRDLRKLRHAGAQVVFKDLPTLLESYATGMFHLDPPDHSRVRKLFAHAFTPAAIARMQATVEETADTLISALPDEGEVELIRDVAKPFPVAVIAGILGVPERDYAALEAWSFAISEIVELTITK